VAPRADGGRDKETAMCGIRGMVGAVIAVAVWCAAAPAADDKAALDKQLYDALKDMHNRAADLYNQGDANGCYRMFQGGLLLARPLLTHRPDVQKLLDDGLQETDKIPSIPQRALKLHKTIEAMREKLKPASPVRTQPGDSAPGTPLPTSPGSNVPAPGGSPAPPAGRPADQGGGPTLPTTSGSANPGGATPPVPAGQAKSLWDRLGGEAVVEKAIDSFVGLVLEADKDKKVNMTRDGKYPFNQAARDEFKYKLKCYVSSVSGGPLIYLGKPMADAHKGMAIKDSEFDEMLKWLKSAFEVQKPSDSAAIEELMKKVQETRKDIVGK
jgi:truncated hemoglobin YjbI